jgi:hypothetical protein
LNAIDNVDADNTFVQPVKTVVKKGKAETKKPRVKSEERAKPTKDYNYGLNSDSSSESSDEEYESRMRTTNINSEIGLGESFLMDEKKVGPKYLETDE